MKVSEDVTLKVSVLLVIIAGTSVIKDEELTRISVCVLDTVNGTVVSEVDNKADSVTGVLVTVNEILDSTVVSAVDSVTDVLVTVNDLTVVPVSGALVMVSGILDSEVSDELVTILVSEEVSVCDIVVLAPSLLVVSKKLLDVKIVVSETALV